jgi:hypothetical protein
MGIWENGERIKWLDAKSSLLSKSSNAGGSALDVRKLTSNIMSDNAEADPPK